MHSGHVSDHGYVRPRERASDVLKGCVKHDLDAVQTSVRCDNPQLRAEARR